MCNLVTDDGRKTVLIVGGLEYAYHYTDLSARHCKCIDRITFEYRHIPVEIAELRFELSNYGRCYAMDILDSRTICFERYRGAHFTELASGFCGEFRIRAQDYLIPPCRRR